MKPPKPLPDLFAHHANEIRELMMASLQPLDAEKRDLIFEQFQQVCDRALEEVAAEIEHANKNDLINDLDQRFV